MRGVTALALAALLLMPMLAVYDAHAAASLFVSQAIKNTNGKAIEQINIGQEAMVSVRVFNYDAADLPFTAIADVRDNSGVSVHVAWTSGVAPSGSYFDAELPWSAQESGSYMVRTFVISGFESPEVISTVSSSQLMVTKSETLSAGFVPGNLTGISEFEISSDGVQYTAWFVLDDSNGKQATFDGKVTITITDSLGEQRYARTFAVASNDFTLFKPTELSAANIAYVWKVPMLNVDRGLGAGTAVLTFVASDGKIYSAKSGPFEIYQASGIELAQDYENSYNKQASAMGKTIVKDNLKVTLVKVGQFTHLANGTTGEQVTHYRADLVIENVGTAIGPWPSQYLLVDGESNEYQEVSLGTLHSGDHVPGFDKLRGYVLFENVSEDASRLALVIKGSNYAADSDDVFEFHIG